MLLDLTTAERDVLAFQIGRSRPGFSQLFELLMDADRATKAGSQTTSRAMSPPRAGSGLTRSASA
jgi:hypothetical protein